MNKLAINFGIIGCGWVARDYVAPAIRVARNAYLTALCDRDLRALRRIADVTPDAKCSTSVEDFLRASNLDAVYIATPNDSHALLTMKAAAAGKHILCEKPMATNYRDAVKMVEACHAHNVTYATAFDQRFHARHRRLREIILNGQLGVVTHARIHYACWNPPDWKPHTDDGTHDNWRVDPQRAGGGALIDLAPHGLDLLQFLLNERITDVRCMMQRKVFETAVDDGSAIICRFAKGGLATLSNAYNCPDNFSRRTLEIIGTQGRALAINTMGQTAGGTLEITDLNGASHEVEIDEAHDVSPFQTQIETFAAALIENRPFPFSPDTDLHTARLIDEAQRQGMQLLTGNSVMDSE